MNNQNSPQARDNAKQIGHVGKSELVHVGDIIHQSPEQERVKLNPLNNLQLTGTANFVGRQVELRQLRDRLQRAGTVAISAVAGMGGVGKTEVGRGSSRQPILEGNSVLVKIS